MACSALSCYLLGQIQAAWLGLFGIGLCKAGLAIGEMRLSVAAMELAKFGSCRNVITRLTYPTRYLAPPPSFIDVSVKDRVISQSSLLYTLHSM